MRKQLMLAAAFAGALAASGLAAAQDSGWYAGLGVGQAKFKDACEGATTCDDKDTSWKIFGGYQFNRNFGAELGYVDLGKASGTGIASGVTVSANAKAKAWELLGVGTIPLANNFSAYGKAGIYRWDVDTSATGVLPGFAPVAASISDNGYDFTLGLGVKYDFTKNVGARLEWQRYNNVGDSSTTGQSDIDLYSLGIVVKF